MVHSHTLEHIYDPLVFFRHLAALVPLGLKLISDTYKYRYQLQNRFRPGL